MINIEDIYKTLYDQFKGICGKTYIQDRPRAVEEKVTDFLVISISSPIRNEEIDDRGTYDEYRGIVSLAIFVRDTVKASNPNELNIKTMSARLADVSGKIPLASNGIKLTKPMVDISESDEGGFHYALITTNLSISK